MTSTQAPPKTMLIAAFAAVYIIWGSTYLAIRYAVETAPPFLMAAIRFLVAGSVLYLWARRTAPHKPTKLQWRNCAIVGVLLLLCGNGGVVWAEQTVPSGITALLVATVPIWLVIVDWLRPGGQRPPLGVAAGLVVGIVGLITLVGLDSLRGEGPLPLLPTIVLILASLFWSIGTLFARNNELPSTPLLGSGMEMLAGGVGLMIASVVSGELSTFQWNQVSATSLWSILYLIVFGSLIAYSAYSWLLHHVPPAAVGTYAYVNPVVAVFLGWFFANEAVTPQTLAGAAIIIIAVFIVSYYSPRTRQSSS